jgi:hypothetical protein
MKSLAKIGLLIFLSLSTAHAENSAGKLQNLVITSTQIKYTCAQANSVKFDKAAYEALPLTDQYLIDGKFNQCDLEQRRLAAQKTGVSPPTQKIVYVINPAPKDGDTKIFYGIAKQKDLENAIKNCKSGGAIGGAAASAVGQATANPYVEAGGEITYNYSGVVCQDVGDAVENNNLMLLISPEDIIRQADVTKTVDDVLAKVPFVSGADKANISKAAKQLTQPAQVAISHNNIVVHAGPIHMKTKLP